MCMRTRYVTKHTKTTTPINTAIIIPVLLEVSLFSDFFEGFVVGLTPGAIGVGVVELVRTVVGGIVNVVGVVVDSEVEVRVDNI